MDYLKEIHRFNEFLPKSRGINAMTISLWHALMYLVQLHGGTSPIALRLATIAEQCKLGKDSLVKERTRLCELGLIRYCRPEGQMLGEYEILPLSEELLERLKKQSLSQKKCTLPQNKWSMPPTISDEKQSSSPTEWSPTTTKQSVTPLKHSATPTTSQSPIIDNIIDINNNSRDIDNISSKERCKREKSSLETRKSPTKKTGESQSGKSLKTPKSTFNSEPWLASLEAPWSGLMRQWLEYKSARKESYKTEVGARKCLSMLKNLSNSNPATAQAIIDQSIANNYAGLFPLKQTYPRAGTSGNAGGFAGGGGSASDRANAPQYGQRIGQIMQPEDEAKRQRLIEKLRNAGNKPVQNTGETNPDKSNQ